MKTIISILLVIIVSLASAQDFELSGQVKDATSKQAVEYASVVILSEKDSIVMGAISNHKGFFSIPLKSGSYKIVCSFVGYKNDTVIVNPFSKNTFVGIISLKPDITILNGIEIKASIKSIELDKDVFFITDSIRKGTSNTKELLERINGVTYDRYSNTVKVDNDKDIVFLVNGIKKDKDYIQNLAPDRIKKVEVIRDPSGRYALEGYSAIINVILKSNYQGQEFYVNEMLLFDIDGTYLVPVNNLNATYNYTYNKVNIYGQYRNSYNNIHLFSSSLTEYSDFKIEENPFPKEKPNTVVYNRGNSFTTGADYYINPNHIVSFECNYSYSPIKHNYNNVELISNTIKDEIIIDSYKYKSMYNKKTEALYGSLFYTGRLSDKDGIEISFNYSEGKNEYNNSLLKRQDLLIETGNNKKDNTNAFIEYNRTVNNKLSLQLGYGNKWNRFSNKYISDYNSTIYNNHSFLYQEFRHIMYSYVSWKINKSFSLKSGISIENSDKKYDTQTENYTIFQPHVDFLYSASENFKIKLKYRAKGNYPTMEQTNPLIRNINANTIIYGNPNLKPYVYNRLSLRLSVLQGLFAIEPYYSFSNNYIVQIGTLKNDSVFEYTYNNSALYQNMGVKFNLTIPIYKSVIFQSDFEIFDSKIEYKDNTNQFKDWTNTSKLLYINQKKGTVIGLLFQKNMRKEITAQGYNSIDNDSWMIIFSQPFMKKRLSIMVGYFIPTNLFVDYKSDNYTMSEGYSRTNTSNIELLKNMVVLQISYRFQKGNAIKDKNKKSFKNVKKKKGFL